MGKTIKLKKGLDIRLKGKAEKNLVDAKDSEFFALQPTDFPGLKPKVSVKPEQKVKAGDVLFYDKKNPEIKFTSPVSGTVTEVERGERRKVLRIVVKPDNKIEYVDFGTKQINSLSREDVIETLLNAGVWPFIRQRPYAVIANPKGTPKSIFISGFDNAPLAPDYDFIMQNSINEFQAGIDALKKLTDGKIHLNISDKQGSVYSNINGVEKNTIIGKHPASTVGTQINHIDPINKGETIWYVNPQDVVIIGRLFTSGKFDARRIVALAGSEVKNPQYYNTILGAQIKSIVDQSVQNKNARFISGNVLTGIKTCYKGYLSFYDSLISVIPEGDYYEFMGWAMPRFHKFSHSRTYFSWLMPNKEYVLDTNTNGGPRAFVMSEEYDKVTPMDIMPEQLLRACLAEDIDKMEQLGIYEVAEEDLALCEFVCTSKTNVQEIIRNGINLMIKELS